LALCFLSRLFFFPKTSTLFERHHVLGLLPTEAFEIKVGDKLRQWPFPGFLVVIIYFAELAWI